MTGEDGRFTQEAMTASMRRIARRLAVADDDAVLLRLTNNAVFALPTARIVIRISRSHRFQDRVHKVVRLAGWFDAVDAATIRLATDLPAALSQPVQDDALRASIWQYLPQPGGPGPTVTDLAIALRAFHALPPPPFPLPRWDPVGDALTRIEDAEDLSAADRDTLLGWCGDLAPRLEQFAAHEAPRLVHGDAHVGNLLLTEDHRPVLCDFDATCLGPWQVDLAAVPVGERRFHRSGTHRHLAAAYGYDVTEDPAWPLLREARELKMIAAAVPLLASTPGVAAEFRHRLHTAVRGDTEARWTPFAQLTNAPSPSSTSAASHQKSHG